MDAWARSVQLSPGTAAAICSLAAKEMDNQHTASICGCAAIFHSNVDMSSSLILIFKAIYRGQHNPWMVKQGCHEYSNYSNNEL